MDKIKIEVPYFQVPNKIFDLGLSNYELVIYMYLCRCGNNSNAFPSYKTIAEKTNISRPKAINTIKDLISKKLIIKHLRILEKNNNESNVYEVITNLEGYDKYQGGKQEIPGVVNDKYQGGKQEIPYKELKDKELKDKELIQHYLSEQNSDEEKNQQKYANDSKEIKIAEYLFEKIKINNPNAKAPNFQSWATHMDYILRIDKRTEEEVIKIIDFCQNDSFWLCNILSTAKLRKQFDQLILKSKEQKNYKKPVQETNYEQRKYTEEELSNLYANECFKEV